MTAYIDLAIKNVKITATNNCDYVMKYIDLLPITVESLSIYININIYKDDTAQSINWSGFNNLPPNAQYLSVYAGDNTLCTSNLPYYIRYIKLRGITHVKIAANNYYLQCMSSSICKFKTNYMSKYVKALVSPDYNEEDSVCTECYYPSCHRYLDNITFDLMYLPRNLVYCTIASVLSSYDYIPDNVQLLSYIYPTGYECSYTYNTRYRAMFPDSDGQDDYMDDVFYISIDITMSLINNVKCETSIWDSDCYSENKSCNYATALKYQYKFLEQIKIYKDTIEYKSAEQPYIKKITYRSCYDAISSYELEFTQNYDTAYPPAH
jgi:hypothetical protein